MTEAIIGAAMEMHRTLDPGLLESTYEGYLSFELRERWFKVEQQKLLPNVYKGVHIDAGYRMDMVVGRQVIVELKAIEHLEPIHEAQLLSYLKLSGLHIGLLINFSVILLRHGIRRLVN